MKPVRLALAAALALVFATGSAAAAESAPAKPIAAKKQQHPRLPFAVKPFAKLVQKQLKMTEAQLDRALRAHRVPKATAKRVKRDFKVTAAKIRTLLKKASADGKVTRREAGKIAKLSRHARQQIRAAVKPGKVHPKGRMSHGRRDGQSRFPKKQ